MNDRCFGDCERILDELKSLFFNTLYFGLLPMFLRLVVMIFFFFLPRLPSWLLLRTLCVHGGALCL
jgi:hypothetical protein